MGSSARAWMRQPLSLAALLCAAGLLLAGLAPSAQADIVPVPSGGRVNFAPLTTGTPRANPLDTTFSNVDYGGGAVMTSNANYTVAWAPAGASFQSGYLPGVAR